MDSYEKTKDETNNFEYIPVGFCSVYPFYTLKREGSKIVDCRRLRISQFLVLPPFQRQGHGRKLLRAVYTYANKGYKEPRSQIGFNALESTEQKTYEPRECYEVTVENPGDDFSALR